MQNAIRTLIVLDPAANVRLKLRRRHAGLHEFAGWKVCEYIKVEGVMGDGSTMYIAKSLICAWPSSYLLSTHVARYNFVQSSRSV
jgi:hypothetical protein